MRRYYEGLTALYSVYPRDDYYKYAVDWSNYHEWGFRNGTTTRNADDYCASQITLIYITFVLIRKESVRSKPDRYAGQHSSSK